SVPAREPLQQDGGVAAPDSFGRRVPTLAGCALLVDEETPDDNREVGGERRSSFMFPKDGAVVFQQRDLHRRPEVLSLRSSQTGMAADASDGAIDDGKARLEQL